MGVSEEIRRAITELGFESPMPVQEEVIPYLLGSNNDVIALAQTGTGKTAAFGIPVLQRLDPSSRDTQALILSPTRELCLQIADDLKDFSKYMNGINIVAVYGGTSIENQIRALRHGAQVIVATPGRLIDLMNRGKANLEKVYNNGKDIEARGNMLKGSYYAGRAFTHAYVGYVHAIAHNLGGLYGTPHGLANAVILPYVLDYYADAAYPKLAKLADIIGITTPDMSVADKGKAFIAEIRRMNKAMNIPEKFDMIKEEDIPTLVERALKEGNPLYPVPKIMDKKDCEAVIRKLMA